MFWSNISNRYARCCSFRCGWLKYVCSSLIIILYTHTRVHTHTHTRITHIMHVRKRGAQWTRKLITPRKSCDCVLTCVFIIMCCVYYILPRRRGNGEWYRTGGRGWVEDAEVADSAISSLVGRNILLLLYVREQYYIFLRGRLWMKNTRRTLFRGGNITQLHAL